MNAWGEFSAIFGAVVDSVKLMDKDGNNLSKSIARAAV